MSACEGQPELLADGRRGAGGADVGAAAAVVVAVELGAVGEEAGDVIGLRGDGHSAHDALPGRRPIRWDETVRASVRASFCVTHALDRIPLWGFGWRYANASSQGPSE